MSYFSIPVKAILADLLAFIGFLVGISVFIGILVGLSADDIKKSPTMIMMFVTLIAVVIGILIQRQTAREKNTLDFEQMYKHNKDIVKNFKRTVKVCFEKRAIELIDPADKDYQAVMAILNEWERAANGIHHKLYDENMLYKVYGTTVIQLWQGLRPFIKFRQEKQPRFYLNFVRLAVRWQIRRTQEEKANAAEQLKKVLTKVYKSSDDLLEIKLSYQQQKEIDEQKVEWQINDLTLRQEQLEKLVK